VGTYVHTVKPLYTVGPSGNGGYTIQDAHNNAGTCNTGLQKVATVPLVTNEHGNLFWMSVLAIRDLESFNRIHST
jgi:hypothetical protein